MENLLGIKLSPVLVEIEDTIIDNECLNLGKPNYSEDGFRAATRIFMHALMDKIYELQTAENIEMIDRRKMVQQAGGDLRNLIKTYTGIDTMEMYNEKG